MSKIPYQRQQGVVIIAALFLMVLVAGMSYAMLSRLAQDTRRTTLLINNMQAEFYAQGSISWAMDQLRNNWERQKANRVVDALSLISPINEVNGFKIVSKIEDMQSRFNLNNLSQINFQADFTRLLKNIDPSLNEAKIQKICREIVAWITPGVKKKEDEDYYLSLPKPYRMAHRMLWSVDELNLMKGMTPQLFKKLRPFVVALPELTPMNVQTVSALVLSSLSPTMDMITANSIIQLRKQQPFLSVQQFMSSSIVKNHPVPVEKISTVSKYFLVQTDVSIANQRIVIYTLLLRSTNNNKPQVNILWQSKGVW